MGGRAKGHSLFYLIGEGDVNDFVNNISDKAGLFPAGIKVFGADLECGGSGFHERLTTIVPEREWNPSHCRPITWTYFLVPFRSVIVCRAITCGGSSCALQKPLLCVSQSGISTCEPIGAYQSLIWGSF